LEECIDIGFAATFALFIRHLACFSSILQVRPHRIVVAVLGSREIGAAPKSD